MAQEGTPGYVTRGAGRGTLPYARVQTPSEMGRRVKFRDTQDTTKRPYGALPLVVIIHGSHTSDHFLARLAAFAGGHCAFFNRLYIALSKHRQI